jgi:imidazolonepropionase-like amidohydrolase
MMDPESYAKILETAKHHLTACRLAVKHNVRIALGTDLGISTPVDHPLALGNSGQELVYAVKDAVMTELQAIAAATSVGPESIGRVGDKPKSGRIEEGHDANLIALTSNPLENIQVFRDPGNVSHVWKGGVLMKRPGR